jgi:hypothetical protein
MTARDEDDMRCLNCFAATYKSFSPYDRRDTHIHANDYGVRHTIMEPRTREMPWQESRCCRPVAGRAG